MELESTQSQTVTPSTIVISRLESPIEESVYLCQPTEYIGSSIYKVGKSSKDMKRMSDYGKDQNKIHVCKVSNMNRTEKKLKKIFTKRFTVARGDEYFEGDIREMTILFLQIVLHAEISSPYKMVRNESTVLTTVNFNQDMSQTINHVESLDKTSQPSIARTVEEIGDADLHKTCPFCLKKRSTAYAVYGEHMENISRCPNRCYNLSESPFSCTLCKSIFADKLARIRHLLYGLCIPFNIFKSPVDTSQLAIRNGVMKGMSDLQNVFFSNGVVYTIGALRVMYKDISHKNYFERLRIGFDMGTGCMYFY